MTSSAMIVTADTLLTMDAKNSVIPDGAVAIEEGRILAVGSLETVKASHPALPVKKIDNALLMPGLINAHAHSGFLRGTAEHLPVWDWLTIHINPMHRVLLPHEAEAASFLCYAESALSGTTTVVDMWRYMDGSARAAQSIGTRLVAVPYVGEHPDYNYFETLDNNEEMIETWHRKAGAASMSGSGWNICFMPMRLANSGPSPWPSSITPAFTPIVRKRKSRLAVLSTPMASAPCMFWKISASLRRRAPCWPMPSGWMRRKSN